MAPGPVPPLDTRPEWIRAVLGPVLGHHGVNPGRSYRNQPGREIDLPCHDGTMGQRTERVHERWQTPLALLVAPLGSGTRIQVRCGQPWSREVRIQREEAHHAPPARGHRFGTAYASRECTTERWWVYEIEPFRSGRREVHAAPDCGHIGTRHAARNTRREQMNDQERFDEALSEILDTMSGGELLQIPGLYEVVSEALNNQVLDAMVDDEDDDG